MLFGEADDEQLWQAVGLLRELASGSLDLHTAVEAKAAMDLAQQAENIGHVIYIDGLTEVGRILRAGQESGHTPKDAA